MVKNLRERGKNVWHLTCCRRCHVNSYVPSTWQAEWQSLYALMWFPCCKKCYVKAINFRLLSTQEGIGLVFFWRLSETEYESDNFHFLLSCVFNRNNRRLKIVFWIFITFVSFFKKKKKEASDCNEQITYSRRYRFKFWCFADRASQYDLSIWPT